MKLWRAKAREVKYRIAVLSSKLKFYLEKLVFPHVLNPSCLHVELIMAQA